MTYRIVFVEDDADLAELISDFLARHEMDVVIESRGDTALATIAREAPDMVLLDIMLPGKDGLLHISEIDWKRLETVEEAGLKEGDRVVVKLVDIDPKTGKFKLSRRALMPKPEGYTEPAARGSRPPRQGGNGGGRR